MNRESWQAPSLSSSRIPALFFTITRTFTYNYERIYCMCVFSYAAGSIPAYYRDVYERICSPSSGNVEREVFKSLLVKSQLSSNVLSQVYVVTTILCLFIETRLHAGARVTYPTVGFDAVAEKDASWHTRGGSLFAFDNCARCVKESESWVRLFRFDGYVWFGIYWEEWRIF